MMGATLIRGIYGMDVKGNLLESRFWSIADHVPVIVEIVDSSEAVVRFLAEFEDRIHGCIVTLERAHVMVHRYTSKDAPKLAGRLDVPQSIVPLSTVPSHKEHELMKLSEDGNLLRVFIGESDQYDGRPLYHGIVQKARELGLAGATVLRGAMGYGANSLVHTTATVELSTDLPIVVELVDTAGKIESIMPFLDAAVSEGLIAVEAVRVLRYRDNGKRAKAASGT